MEGQGQVQFLPAGDEVGNADAPEISKVSAAHLLCHHFHDVGPAVAGVLILDDRTGPAKAALAVEGHGEKLRLLVRDVVHAGAGGDTFKGRQVRFIALGKAPLHGDAAAGIAPAALPGHEAAVELVIGLDSGGAAGVFQKLPGDLAVQGGGHVADDVRAHGQSPLLMMAPLYREKPGGATPPGSVCFSVRA